MRRAHQGSRTISTAALASGIPANPFFCIQQVPRLSPSLGSSAACRNTCELVGFRKDIARLAGWALTGSTAAAPSIDTVERLMPQDGPRR
jgi:hypothetical protein